MWFGEVNGTTFTPEEMEPWWAAVSPEGGVFWPWIQSSLQGMIIHSIMGTRMILGGKYYTAPWLWYFFLAVISPDLKEQGPLYKSQSSDLNLHSLSAY